MVLLTPFSYSGPGPLDKPSFYLYPWEDFGPPAPEDPTVFLLRSFESLFIHLFNEYLLSAAYLLYTQQRIGNRAVGWQVFYAFKGLTI